MNGHIRGFKYLGGVPREILYDNMKHVVMERDAGGQPVFNPEFLRFAHHYGFQPKTCAPYGPWMKGQVERPIDFLRERFWRGYTFSSLQQTNRDVRVWLKTPPLPVLAPFCLPPTGGSGRALCAFSLEDKSDIRSGHGLFDRRISEMDN